MFTIAGYGCLCRVLVASANADGVRCIFARGAFDDADTSRAEAHVYCHGSVVSIARSSDGSLRFTPDDYGLQFAADLVGVLNARELCRAIHESPARWGASVRARWASSDRVDRTLAGQRIREVRRVREIRDVTITQRPRIAPTLGTLKVTRTPAWTAPRANADPLLGDAYYVAIEEYAGLANAALEFMR